MSEQLVRFINFGIAGSAPQVPASGKRLYLLPNGDFATIDANGVVTSLATRWEAITGKPTEFPPEPHLSSKITDFAAAVVAAAPPTTNASLLTAGTLPDARLAATIARSADLTTEQNARIAGDAALSTRIDYLAANLDPAALDSIAEAAASIGSLQSQINGKAATVHTHLAADITDFTSAVALAAPIAIVTSPAPPASPQAGMVWFDETTLRTYVRYDNAWVEVVNGYAGETLGNIDGGTPATIYGGTNNIVGGTP